MAGSGADAEQAQKRAAAAAYDYEGNTRWSGYWSNILVPPNLASRPDSSTTTSASSTSNTS